MTNHCRTLTVLTSLALYALPIANAHAVEEIPPDQDPYAEPVPVFPGTELEPVYPGAEPEPIYPDGEPFPVPDVDYPVPLPLPYPDADGPIDGPYNPYPVEPVPGTLPPIDIDDGGQPAPSAPELDGATAPLALAFMLGIFVLVRRQ